MSNIKMISRLFLFVILFGICTSECINGCSNRGRCLPVNNGTCICQNGFYTSYCSQSVATTLPHIFTMYRAFGIVFSMLLFILALLVFFLKKDSTKVELRSGLGAWSVRKFIAIWCAIMMFHELLHFIVDPDGQLYRVPYVGYRLFFFAFKFPALVVLIASVLIHWLSVYSTILYSISRAEKIRKIRPDLEFNLTIEDIIHQTNIANRLAIPPIVGVIVATIYQYIRESLIVSYVLDTRHWFIQPLWLSFYALLYFLYFIGFWYVGWKLPKYMPDFVAKKMRRLSNFIRGITLLFLASWMVTVGIFSSPKPGPYYYLAGTFSTRLGQFVIVGAVLSMFVEPNRKFPFIFKSVSNSGSSDLERARSTNRTYDSNKEDEFDSINPSDMSKDVRENESDIELSVKDSEKQLKSEM